MPFQPIVPTWLALNSANDTSPSYFTDLRLGIPVLAGGLNVGDFFDLTDAEANTLSYKTNGILYSGRYRRVQVDSGATAANVKTGTIGVMPSLAVVSVNPLGTKNPPVNIVTSFDQAIGNTVGGIRMVVFLNSITPGNYGFVQELGIASVLGKPTLTAAAPAIGDVILAVATGVVDDPTQSGSPTYTLAKAIIGEAVDIPVNNGLFRVLLQGGPVVQG